MKISLMKKVVAAAGATALAALGVLLGVLGAAPAQAESTTVTWLRNGGSYGDGRENLCLDVLDLEQTLTMRPCSGGKTTQSWKITYISTTNGYIENTHYHRCIGSLVTKQLRLIDCGLQNTKKFFTTNQLAAGWLSLHTPDKWDPKLSELATPGTLDKVELSTSYYAGSPEYANPRSRWQAIGRPAYYPPPKTPCTGIRCPDPDNM